MKSKKVRLSVVLAVFNEESNLKDCLDSIKEIADEIVIVDGGSKDKTIEIAESFDAKVIKTDNPQIFHINKQKALDAATGEWILQLDADERVSKELAKEVRKIADSDDEGIENHDVDPKKYDLLLRHLQLLAKRDGTVGTEDGDIAAFFMARKNYFLGKYLMHGGAYPDGTVRLVKKGHAHFKLEDVHDQMIIDGRVSVLSSDLIHMADPNFERYLFRSNRYTSLQAKQWFDAHNNKEKAPHIHPLARFKWTVIEPLKVFWKLYIRHKGYRDGFAGRMWAKYSALHISSSYVKYWEMRTTKAKPA